MADPFNLATQYERQLAAADDSARRFTDSVFKGASLGLQIRSQRLNERLLNQQIRGLEQQNSINEQLMQNPTKLVNDFGDLKTTEERLQFLAKNAGIAATPAGAKVLQQLEGIAGSMAQREVQTAAFQAKILTAKKQAELASKYGVDPQDPDGIAWATKSEAIDGMIEQARLLGRELTAGDIPDDLFDANGRIDPKRRLEVINSAGVTEALDLQRDALNLRETKPVLDPDSAKPILIDGKPTGKAVLNTGAVIDVAADRTKSLTEAQANALSYSERMAYNNRVVEDLMASGFDPTALSTNARNIGPNATNTAEFQQYDAARKNWVAAVLRKESGAAISASEYKTAFEQYFPRFGDSAEVVAQKAELRKLAEANMRKAVGDISADRAPAGTAVQVQETVSIPSFNDEESARAAGLKAGDIFWFYDPNTATKRKARLK